ncbi:MAG: LysR family transcriptional regulator [Deltaproteobacteria bacterium]|nr:LysR family transcriptional regulator [Deltaproteobacteria bacterium]
MSTSHEVAGLHGVDLNLLLAFDALAEARNVTRAAERAGVTQSAMSHTLAKLRRTFDDPLLVRGARGMDLTPRAEAMRVPVRAALVALRRALDGPSFEPEKSERTFRISGPGLFVALFGSELRLRTSAEAPRVAFVFSPPSDADAAALETGDLDLRVVADVPDVDVGVSPASHLRRRGLLREGFRTFVGRAGPLGERRRLSRKAFLEASHVLVSPRGGGPGLVDRQLGDDRRRVAMRVSGFAEALEVVARTDLVLTGPASLRILAEARGDVRHFAPPVEVPTHAIGMVWHPRDEADPGHRWLRERLVECIG